MLYHKYGIGVSQRIGLLVYYILVCIVIQVSVSEIKGPEEIWARLAQNSSLARKSDFYNVTIKKLNVRNSISWPRFENFSKELVDQLLRVILVLNLQGLRSFLSLIVIRSVKMLLHNVVRFMLYYFISLCKYNNNILNAIEAAFIASEEII